MKEIKNWDKNTWLSSSAYINIFNSFLFKKKKINKNSRILDIGCARGKIFGSLSRKLKLSNKPYKLKLFLGSKNEGIVILFNVSRDYIKDFFF